MDVILNENQYKKIILEVAKKKIEGSSEENKNLIKRIVSDVKREFKLDLKFILTYSVTIGGLIGPVYEIVSSSIPSLSSVEMSLISVGVIMTYYYNNVELLNRILIKIRDNGLINEFNLMLEKTENLKLAFLDFVQSLNVTIGSMSNILAFTFLLNVLSTLVNFAENDFTDLETSKLIISLLGYFGTLASKHITKELLTKMIERFKSKK
jgi:hypothetical protein